MPIHVWKKDKCIWFILWTKALPMFPYLCTDFIVFLTLRERLLTPPVFGWVRVARSLFLCVVFCRSLFVFLYYFLVICPSSICGGIVVIVIVWQLDLQLPMQSVPITTMTLRVRIMLIEVYSIQHYVIKFVSDLRQVGGFLLQ
jgi:hypothetical protein